MSIFRKEYRELTPDEVNAIAQIKDKAEELHQLLGMKFKADAREVAAGAASAEEFTVQADFRSMALAKTKLEESVMWAVKGITG